MTSSTTSAATKIDKLEDFIFEVKAAIESN